MAIERITEEGTLIEVRPTLIVGLGGTGVLICQWAYQLIRELLGTVPPFIKFLSVDTDAQEEGGPCNLPDSDFFDLFHRPIPIITSRHPCSS